MKYSSIEHCWELDVTVLTRPMTVVVIFRGGSQPLTETFWSSCLAKYVIRRPGP
jgi:hypothetical protein